MASREMTRHTSPFPRTISEIIVTMDDLKSLDDDDDRFIEIPDDLMGMDVNRTSAMIVERRGSQNEWPLSKKVHVDMRHPKIGDIFDIFDAENKWYEGMAIYSPNDHAHPHFGEVVIHFIGWTKKWTEWVPITDKRMAIRGTHTRGPHQSFPIREKTVSNFYNVFFLN